jgi:hypothetical protein
MYFRLEQFDINFTGMHDEELANQTIISLRIRQIDAVTCLYIFEAQKSCLSLKESKIFTSLWYLKLPVQCFMVRGGMLRLV